MSVVELGACESCARRAPTPAAVIPRIRRGVDSEAGRGALLLVSRDRFVANGEWYISQAVVRVPDQAALRRALHQGLVDDTVAESLVEIQQTLPLRRSERQVDAFLAELERALGAARGGPVAVRVTEPRWAAALREYQGLFPSLHVLPGHDPVVACLSAACMRVHVRERRRVVRLLESRREWTSFSGRSGRGHVAPPARTAAHRGAGQGVGGTGSALVDGPLQIASDGARNPHRGTSWGYFGADGTFRLGVCLGGIVAGELHGLLMALEDHLDRPVVVWTDSRRALGLVNTVLRSGMEPHDRSVARDVRRIAEIIEDRRGAGLETRVQWVRAHTAQLGSTPTVLNDAADRLAKLALRRWCTPGLAEGIEDIALSIAHEAVASLGDLPPRSQRTLTPTA